MKNTLLDAVAALPRRNTMLDAVNAAPVAEDTYGEAITPYDSEFDKALRRSSAGTVSAIQGLGGAVQDLYDHEGAKKVFDEARKRVELVNRANSAQVNHIKDIHSLSDALAYVPNAIGEAVPTMATALGGGLVGRALAARLAPKLLEKPLAAELAGGAVGMFPQEAGETAMELASDPEAMKNTTAAERAALMLGKGTANSILEAAVPAWTANKLVGSAMKQAVAKGDALKHIGKTTMQGGFAEGATEGTQDLVGGLTHKVANPEHYIDPWDVADAVVKGTIPGHAFGALGGVGDVVHSRLGGVEDAGPQPTKLDRVAEAVGSAAGKAAAKATSAIERRLDAHLARQDDPDLAFFTRPDDINPNGRSDSELMDMIASDDAARAQAAINYATKVMQRAANSDGVSDEELQAAADFLGAAKNGQLSADAVRQFGDQINNIKRRGNAQSTFVSAAQDLVTPALERKGNAMSVTPESETGRAQQQHQIAKLWLQDMAQANPMFAELDTTDPQVTTAMLAIMKWISNGFSYEKGGKKFLPKSIDALGEAAAPAILSAYKLLRRQGLTEVTDLEALKMARAIEARQNANRGTLSYVLENFTPLALKSFGSREQAAAMAQQVTTALRQLNDGKLVMTPEADAMLTEYFGPNKARVLKAFRKSQQASAETKLDAEGAQDGTGIEDEANPDIEAQAAQDYETGLNREWSPDTDVVYHGFGKDNKPLNMDFESARRDLLNKRNEVAGANPKSYVREIGVHDMLREQHAGDAEALKRAEDALLEAQGIRLHPKDVEGRRKNLAALNRKYRLIREEVYSDKDEIEVKNVNELKDIEKFKDKKGKLVDVSTVKHGRLYLEQEHIDDETGEITTKPFVTSAAKLIRHASKGVESTKEGAAELHDKLMAGLSALLTAKDGKFTGRVGYRKVAGGDIHWMKPGEELPADFTFFEEGGVSEADAKSQRAEPKLSDDDKRKAVSATAKYLWHYDERKARALFNLLNSSELPIEAIDEAVDTIGAADSSIDSVYDAAMVLRKEAQLAYQQLQEPANDTDPMLGKEASDRDDVVPSEVEVDGNRPIKRDARGNVVSKEPTGALITGDKRFIVPDLKVKKPVHRETGVEKLASHEEVRTNEKQFKWVVDTLRKGVPAFIKAVKNATEAQREGIREALVEFRGEGRRNMWRTTAKITEFATLEKRAEVALKMLKALNSAEESAEASLDRYYRGLVQPADTLAKQAGDTRVWALFKDNGDDESMQLVGYTADFDAANYVAKQDNLVKMQVRMSSLRRFSAKQFKWIVDTLRKGVPAFIKAVKNATEAQRKEIREALIDLRTVDQNDVRLTTARITDFAAFKKRVEVALRALNGAEESAENKPARIILPQVSRYAAKDQAKSDRANKFIGRGAPGSSTAAYAEAWGNRANVGEYSPKDTVFISVNGNRPGALPPPWSEIKKAMAGGATLITDVPADRARPFNTGERAVAAFLASNGYVEVSPGEWKPLKPSTLADKAGDMLDKGMTAAADRIMKKNLQGGDGSGSGVIQFPTHRTRRTARQQDEDFIESEVAAVVAKQEKAVAEAEARVERAKRLNTGRMAEIVAVARTMPPEVFENNPVYENMTPLERRAFHSIMEADEELAFERSVLNDMRKSLESAKASSTTDRIVKKNLQDATPAEHPSTHAPAEGKPGSATNPHVVPMYYKMKPQEVREDLRSRYPNGTTTAQLIADGLRTATTRRPQQGVLPGHYIKFPGVPGLYRVVKFEKVDLKTAAGKKQWAQREGWDTDAAMSAFPNQVRDGAIQMVFERVDRKPLKPSAQSTTSAKQLTDAERQAIIDEARKTLGPGVKVAFEPFIQGTNGQEWSGDWVDGLIRISIGAQDHAGVGRHESIHQLFKWLRQHGANNIKKLIENAATNPIVKSQLERLLSDHPNAIAQLSDPEEAAAFLYQFWKAGQVKLGEQTTGLFNKIAKAIGRMWQHFAAYVLGSANAKAAIAERENMARAEVLLQYFAEGKFANGDEAVLKALDAKLGEQLKQAVAKSFIERFMQNDVLRKVVYTAGNVLRDTGNPHFQQIADLLYTPEGGKFGKQALFEATAQERARRLNALNKIVLDKDPEDLKLALKYLQARTDDRNIHAPAVKEIVQGVRKFLVDMHNYMLERGVQRWDEKTKKWVPVPAISRNYFPVAWDVDKIAADPQAFIKKLMEVHAQELEAIARDANNEVANGKDAGELSASKTVQGRAVTAEDVAYAITQRIITSSGAADISESTSSLGITPFAKSVNKRSLWWIEHDKFTDFMSDDLAQIMTNYTVQVVKRGEYVPRLGNEGEVLQELATKAYVHELLGEGGVAKAEAKLKEMEVDWQRRKAAARANGQSDDTPKPTLRQAAESLLPEKERNARVQEALKKIEVPIKAIMAGEGTLGRDIDPNVRQIMSGVMTYQNMRLMALSLFSSIVDPLGMLIRGGTLNDSWQGFVRGVKEIAAQIKGEKTNDLAAQLAEYLGTVDAGTYLDALGQTYSSLFVQGKLHKINNAIFRWNGMEAWNRAMRIQATQAAIGFIKRHLSTPTDQSERYLKDELGLDPKLKDQFMKDGELDYTNDAVKAAIMRWVDGAILRPNAMQRPIVASDPHYALFYHLKQFAYSFHKTILQRAWLEAKHGNYAPFAALFSTYIPVMIAADVVKEVLVPGDDPDWMKGGLGDYFWHGFLRANLMGVPQFGYEAISNPFKDPTRSVESAAGLFGPAVSQATGILLAPLTEKHTAGGEFINALPGAVIANRMTR